MSQITPTTDKDIEITSIYNSKQTNEDETEKKQLLSTELQPAKN